MSRAALKSILWIWISLPVTRRYRARAMVIGVVSRGSVRDVCGGHWRGRGTPSPDNTIDVLCGGEYLCFSTVPRIVYSLSSGIGPDVGLPLIDSPEDRRLLCLCSSSTSVILIETLLIDRTPQWLSPSPGNGERCSCHQGSSRLELRRGVSGCPWWGCR